MFCEKCGNELPEGAKFCDKCGTMLGSEAQNGNPKEKTEQVLSTASSPVPAQTQQEAVYLDKSSYSQIFVEPNEQLQGTLGNGWITNMLFHKLKKCNALLTDKRLYLQGTFFSGSGKSLMTQRYEKVIDLEDITGSGFKYSSVPVLMIVLSSLFAILGICGFIQYGPYTQDSWEIAWVCFGVAAIAIISDICAYIKSRKTFFLIEYPGGDIRFNASIIGIADVRDFQKQIRRAKDKVKGKI